MRDYVFLAGVNELESCVASGVWGGGVYRQLVVCTSTCCVLLGMKAFDVSTQ